MQKTTSKMRSCILIIAVLVISLCTVHTKDIFNAVKNNNMSEVKRLIDKDGSLVSSKDDAGNTPLHHAAMIGSDSIIEFLLSRGADINAQNTQLNAPLFEAIQNKQENSAAFLVQKGADLNMTNIHKQTPLHKAASLNQWKIGKTLIEKGAAIDPVDAWKRTPFQIVARQTGDVEFGKLLMNKGANINAKDSNNLMALNLAAWKGFNGFINFLLDNGAEYFSSPRESRWMLNHAAQCGSIRLFRAVLEKEHELLSDDRFSKNLMHTAIRGGSIDIVKGMLAENVHLTDEANQYGWTPAHYAARNGRAAMIRFLSEKGWEMHKRTLSGKSVYNVAEEEDQNEVLETLKVLSGDTGPRRFPELTGPYLGETPPAGRPVLFAPDIVSGPDGDDNHGSFAMTPDGEEIYWNMRWKGRGKIWMTRHENDRWMEPQIAPFSKDGSHMDDNPFITPDGQKLFFTSTRPGSVSEGKENIWVVERTSSGWSEPKPVSDAVNAMQLHWGISVSSDGTLYFGGTGKDSHGRTDIYCAEWINGEYNKPVNIGSEINDKGVDHCPYIAPDEAYIIFSRFGPEGGFYISFKDKAGNWLEPVKIHEHLEGVCPYVSPDGKYFFFNLDGIYWMPAGFIDALKPKQ